MTSNTALFISNLVMVICITVVNACLFYFWPAWHSNTVNQADNHLFYMIWVGLPYGLLLITNFFIKDSVSALLFLSFSAIFFLFIALINYIYYMAVLSDGSSGLIFTILPFLQLIGSLVLIIVATIIHGVKPR